MATINSAWATSPITIDGTLTAPEWLGAGTLALTSPGVNVGALLVKNDADNLYLALDLTRIDFSPPPTTDYYWIVVDVDRNAAITPNVDGLFSSLPGHPNDLRRWFFLGPYTTKPINTATDVIQSIVHQGFGPSSRSAIPHRMWEFRFKLSELGVDFSDPTVLPVVRFGVRVHWDAPAPGFTEDSPANLDGDFTALHQIVLQRVGPFPPGTVGPVIGGVGLIPAGQINSDGYANTAASYYVPVTDSAFGGTMHLVGNHSTLQALWTTGARKYRILRSVGAGPFAPISQMWTNYRRVGFDWVLENFGPDASNFYPMLDPGQDYSIKDLLLQWASNGELAGVHRFQAEFYTPGGALVPSAAQTLTLMLDNNAPNLQIVDIKHGLASISACAIETLSASASDGLRFTITAADAAGHMHSYSLAAEFGDNESSAIASDNYVGKIVAHHWNGVTNLVVPAGVWRPPRTCAYGFYLYANKRVTNGYTPVFSYDPVYRYVTLIVPAAAMPTVLSVAAMAEAMYDVRPAGHAQ